MCKYMEFVSRAVMTFRVQFMLVAFLFALGFVFVDADDGECMISGFLFIFVFGYSGNARKSGNLSEMFRLCMKYEASVLSFFSLKISIFSELPNKA